jgi:hypothetical protein
VSAAGLDEQLNAPRAVLVRAERERDRLHARQCLLLHSPTEKRILTDRRVQLNVLDEPADMTFNLTESPWIRAGKEYAVRVRAPPLIVHTIVR